MRNNYLYLRDKVRRNDTLTLCSILFLVSFALRLLVLYQPQIVSNDSLFYVMLAKSVASGNYEAIGNFTFFSIHPFLIALCQKIIPDWEMAGRMVSLLCGTFAVIPLFLLFSMAFDKRTAFIAGLLYAFGPRFVEYSTDILRESTFWFFSASALYLALKGIKKRKIQYFLFSSIVSIISFATRVEGLALFPVASLWILYAFVSKELSLRRTVLYLVTFLFAIPVIVITVIAFLGDGTLLSLAMKTGHKFSLIMESGTAGIMASIDADVLRQMPSGPKLLLELAEDHKYMLFAIEIIFKTFKSMTIIPVLLLLAGIFFRKALPFSKRELYMLIWIAVLFVVSICYMRGTYYFSTRHGLLIGMPALLWSAIGLLELKTRLAGLIEKTNFINELWKPFTPLVVSFIVFVALFSQALVSSVKDDKMDLKITGIELKEKGYGKHVMLVQPGLHRIAFYAGSEYAMMPERLPPDRIAGLMKEKKADILIVDLDSIESVSPDFNNSIDKKRFKRIEVIRKPRKPGYSLAVYKLNDL